MSRVNKALTGYRNLVALTRSTIRSSLDKAKKNDFSYQSQVIVYSLSSYFGNGCLAS